MNNRCSWWRSRLVLSAVGLALPLALVQASAARAAAPVTRVSYLAGRAYIGGTQEGPWKAVKRGARLKEKGYLKTGKDSRLEIALDDGSLVRLGPETLFELRSLIYGGGKGGAGRKAGFKLFLGRLWSRVKSFVGTKSTFEVRTPTAVAGVRGTTFRMDVVTDTSTLVRIYRGRVAVSNRPAYMKETPGGERVQVPGPQEVTREQWEEYVAQAMQEVRVSAAGRITPPETFTLADEKSDPWVQWNLARDRKQR